MASRSDWHTAARYTGAVPTPLQERRNPFAPAWMECPRCRESNGWVIDDDCPCCRGEGRIRLGPAALSIYEPVVVAKAVAMVYTKHQDNPADAFEDLAMAGVVKKQKKRLPVEPELEPVPFKAKRPPLKHRKRRRR